MNATAVAVLLLLVSIVLLARLLHERRVARVNANAASRLERMVENMRDAFMVDDVSGRVIFANDQFLDLFGITREELDNIVLEDYVALDYRASLRERHARRVAGEEVPSRFEYVGLRKDRSKIWLEVQVTKTFDRGVVTGTQSLIRDVTEHKRREIEAQRSLHEKEALLKEIHHRVKNNLQVIASLLKLQSRGLPDGPGLMALNESRNRVYTMGLVHELLYRSDDITGISLQNYFEQLGQHLLRSYGLSEGPIDLEVDAGSVEVEIDLALPLSLIVNELISNSLKHAFKNGERGSISLSAREVEDTVCELIVQDSGVGLPDDFRERTNGGLGLGLVEDLVAQLNASIAFDSSSGTKVTIRFPVAQHFN